MMNKVWFDRAWDDYEVWQQTDKKISKRINILIKDIERNGNSGIGNPEPLKYDLSGFWSREIDKKHRLVYRIEQNQIEIAQCKGHYDD
jgi:toxin YoeB